MAQVTLKGNPINVDGQLPQAGQQAPAFSLVGGDLSDVTLARLSGKRKVLNIFPSIDTPTCPTSVRKFNVEASKQESKQASTRRGEPHSWKHSTHLTLALQR